MKIRSLFLRGTAVALALSLAGPAAARSIERIPVVATFSILGDMVERIGGERVTVTTLVGPDGDTHVYVPTPADARAVSEAQVLVANGLAFEGWLDRLVDASDFDGTHVAATEGIEPIAYEEGDDHDESEAKVETREQPEGEHDDEHHGAFDPHAWQSLDLAVTYVDNITAALARTDPSNATRFYRNRAAYVAEIEALDAEIREIVAGLSAERRTVVTSHDAFQYLARDYGLIFLAPQGLSTESEASARDVARLIEQMKDDDISAVFVENITDSRLLEQIANETGAVVGGTLFPGALSGPDGPAGTYLDLVRHNVTTLAQALGSAQE